jgi:GTP 3',8-cyclase
MPEEEYAWLERPHILSFEEISRLVDAFIAVGVTKVRLTGGEPLLRPDLPALVEMLAAKPEIQDLALTTNGVLLARNISELRRAGLMRLTVSLDTLQSDRFSALTRRSSHDAVLEGIRSVTAAGMPDTKIDTVVMRGVNDDELPDLIEFGREVGAEVRFIEYMDVAGATKWASDVVVPRSEIVRRIAAKYGPVEEFARTGSAPADRFALPDGTVFGVISATTQPFCGSCDRGRLTADGQWYGCLYAMAGIDLRTPLRAGESHDELVQRITGIWRRRDDRGAEERRGRRDREAPVGVTQLRLDPHLEMHTRGG